MLALALLLLAADDDRSIRVVSAKSLPAFESVIVYRGGAKAKPLGTHKLDAAFAVDGDAVDVFAKPKDGLAVPVLVGRKLKPGERLDVKLADVLGTVEVFQKDGFAKVDRIVLTAPDDAGPDEKGHAPIQTGSDYRVEMPVPEGFYSVWLVPANGARATRIEDRIRVLPGKIVRLGD